MRVRRVVVVRAVPRQEGDPATGHGADGDGRGRVAVRRGDGVLLGVLDERVEAGAADHGHLCDSHAGNCASRLDADAARTTSSASDTVAAARLG